ncbi:serine acetyltransferase [Methanosphaerula subterraneus]|uniref:serine acetyltransferase n=1 Tax=Methanosphaerula subterraneus TaxID=3350244 RepID=UPI003F8636D5
MGIQSKEDYLRYLEADRRALNRSATRPRLFGDEVWKFERLLRRVEYYENCKRAWYHYPALLYLSVKFRLYSLLLGFTIPQHVFGPGLSIANRGTIVVNSCARVGANCRLHICVNIGSRAGTNTEAPIIGDNVYIGPGVVMFGRITIADNIAIGANSVVTKSFSEPDITIVGAPARKIGGIGTSRFYDTGVPPGEQDRDVTGLNPGS